MRSGTWLPGCLLALVIPAFAQTPLSLFSTSDVWRFAIGRTQDGYIVSASGGTPTPALNNTVCYVFTHTGSVPGLAFSQGANCNFSYRLSGTPTTPGTYPISVTVNDGQGSTPATRNFQVIVFPRLEIVTQTLPDAEDGAPYSFQIEYRGGWTPYLEVRCSLTFPGLTCDSTGRITGSPGAGAGLFQGAVDFFIRDGFENNTVRRLFDLNVQPGLRIVDTLPPGTVGTAYSRQLTASGGRSPYQFAAASGLPGGLSLSSSGVLSGTPTTAGTFQIQVRVTDANGTVAGTTLPLVIAPRGPLRIVNESLPEACIGQPYFVQLTATGNEGPVRWGAVNLAPGLSINPATGVISGTPTGPAGERVVGIGAATDTQSAGVDLRLNVKDCSQPAPNPTPEPTPALRITNTLQDACAGQPYTAQLTVTGADGPVSFAVENLPAGLSFNPATGVISGTPSGGLGDLNVSITAVTDTQSANVVLKLTVKACPAPTSALEIENATLGVACIGESFAAQMTAKNIVGTVEWSATNLPAGLSINRATGAISGVVAGTAGVRAVAITATTLTQTATASISIEVKNCTTLQAPKGFVNEPYFWQFTAPGDVTILEIPSWATWHPVTRSIGGTPTQEGKFRVTLNLRTSPFEPPAQQVYEIVVERRAQVPPPDAVVVSPGSSLVLPLEPRSEASDVILKVFGRSIRKVPVTTSGPLQSEQVETEVPTILRLFSKEDYVGPNGGTIKIGDTLIPYILHIPPPEDGWRVRNSSHFNTSKVSAVFFAVDPPRGLVGLRGRLDSVDGRAPTLVNLGPGRGLGAAFDTRGVPPGTYSFSIEFLAVDEQTGGSSTHRFPFTVTVPEFPVQFTPVGLDYEEAVRTGRNRIQVSASPPPGVAATYTVNGVPATPNELENPLLKLDTPHDILAKLVTQYQPPNGTPSITFSDYVPSLFNSGGNIRGFVDDHAFVIPGGTPPVVKVFNFGPPQSHILFGSAEFRRLEQLGRGLSTITLSGLPPGEGLVCTTTASNETGPPDPGATGTPPGQSCLAYSEGAHSNVVPAGKEVPGQRPADACTPTRLIPLFTRPAPMASVKAGVPEFLRVWVYDNCGVPRTDAAVNLAFRNGDAPIALTHTGRGRYSAMWTPQRSTDAYVSIVASVAAGAFTARKSNLVSVAANPAVAIFDQRSIVSGASFEASRPRAPGEFVSIFGSNLAPRTESARALPLPTTLGGVSLTFNGRPVPLLFVSPAQINLILPYDVPVHQFLEFYLIRDNVESGPIRVPVAAAQPAIFSRDLTGRGQGIILDPQFRFYDAANPAAAGNAFVIYLSGLGEVTPAVEAGSPAPTTSLHRVRLPVRVTIGGVAVTDIAFAGLAPGLTGVYQLNGVVPAGVPPGNAVPVVVAVDGMSSPAVTMAVR